MVFEKDFQEKVNVYKRFYHDEINREEAQEKIGDEWEEVSQVATMQLCREEQSGYASMEKGRNYRITCQREGCDYDKISATEWGAEVASFGHWCDNPGKHSCTIREMGSGEP